MKTSDKVAHRRWMEGLVVYIFDDAMNRKLFDGYDLWKDDPVKEENTLYWMLKALRGNCSIVKFIHSRRVASLYYM